jgi:hypothetical protein
VTTGDSPSFRDSFARLRGLLLENQQLPGAHAPGFTLTPASQVKKILLLKKYRAFLLVKKLPTRLRGQATLPNCN